MSVTIATRYMEWRLPVQPLASVEPAQRHLAQFERLVDEAEVVSFDLFDTLIQRQGLFSPKDLFYQVADEAERQINLRIDQFTALRIRAEEIPRVRAWGRRCEEVTLSEIYAEVARMLACPTAAAQRLQEIELACERSVLTHLASGQRGYQAALAANKRVIIVSDTYFEQEFIDEILHRLGYRGAFRVYLSSTWGKTKSKGSLYDLVLQDLACTPHKLLHIGDNQLADVSMALSRGIQTLYTPTAKQQLRRRYGVTDQPSGNLGMATLLSTLSQRGPAHAVDDPTPQSVIVQTATENLSLLYYGFAAWLVARVKQGGYRRVYFAAREGLVMKRFFDLVAHTADLTVDSRYLYISRAALYPSLIFTDPATARNLFCRAWDYLTLDEVLRRVGLSYAEHRQALAAYGLTDRTQQLDMATAAQLSAFLSAQWPRLERNHTENLSLILDYLRQENLLNKEKAAFVDIGWHGSLQNCLLKLLAYLGINKELDGLYLGAFEKPSGASANFSASGFLVDNGAPSAIADLVRFGPSLLELLHSAGHGGVLGYRRNGTQVAPVLEQNMLEWQQFQAVIDPMQNQAFALVAEHLAQLPRPNLTPPDPELLARMALRPVYAPTPAEAALFGHLRIATDFGGRMKSITGVQEWDLKTIAGDLLPDGTAPIWRPGFAILKQYG